MDRRTFAQQVTGAVIGGALAPPRPRARVSAVLFDAFVVFDPRPVTDLAEQLYPGRGTALTSAWRAKQFEYAWLHVVMRSYTDFWRCSADALRHAATTLQIALTPSRHEQLMQAYLQLRPWPDVPAALERLRAANVGLGLLSNFTPAMLAASIRTSRLGGAFGHVLSTDRARTYKPDPRAYQLGLDALGLPRERVVFAAFAGWDAAGAKRFGFPTLWVNRLGAPMEDLGAPAPDAIVRTLSDAVGFVRTTH